MARYRRGIQTLFLVNGTFTRTIDSDSSIIEYDSNSLVNKRAAYTNISQTIVCSDTSSIKDYQREWKTMRLLSKKKYTEDRQPTIACYAHLSVYFNGPFIRSIDCLYRLMQSNREIHLFLHLNKVYSTLKSGCT